MIKCLHDWKEGSIIWILENLLIFLEFGNSVSQPALEGVYYQHSHSLTHSADCAAHISGHDVIVSVFSGIDDWKVLKMSSESEVSVGMAEFEARSQNSDDTLVVLEFSPKAPPETKEWLMALIRSPGEFPFITRFHWMITNWQPSQWSYTEKAWGGPG